MSDTEDLDSRPPAPSTNTQSTVAPVLSTTDDASSFNFTTPNLPHRTSTPQSDSTLRTFFEISRTIQELRSGGWARIALQFPDELLALGAARVCEIIQKEVNAPSPGMGEEEGGVKITAGENDTMVGAKIQPVKVFILADTSYGSCCVDEIAAQHISADVLVHYGRACLSPTTRLPVIYVFTKPPLNYDHVVASFKALYPPGNGDRKERKVVVMADVMYTSHLSGIVENLRNEEGYTGIWEARVVHDPGALLPNRTVPEECMVGANDGQEEKIEKARKLREDWGVFHIGTPMASLLLVLASRVGTIHVYPTDSESNSSGNIQETTTTPLQTLPILRRRYALLTHLRSASIIGILVSTLTVKNYLSLISLLQRLIHSKGKKSYMVVVGKVNPEKLANFSEIEGWVGVGCWEQGVVGGALERGDGGRGFWRGVVTPWELGVALGGMGEQEEDEDEDSEGGTRKEKVKRWEWNGEWITDFDTLLARDPTGGGSRGVISGDVPVVNESSLRPPTADHNHTSSTSEIHQDNPHPNDDNDDHFNPLSHLAESAPPEFDLRTGRYSSSSYSIPPPTTSTTNSSSRLLPLQPSSSAALTHIPNSNHQLTIKGGVISPAAEFLREKRTWRGLVVGYEEEESNGGGGEEGARLEVGRSGVARGYTVGDEEAGEKDRR